MTPFSTFPPGWYMLLIERSPDVLIGPLSDPRGWSDSMGYPGSRLTLLALLGALAAAVAWGRGGPPRGGIRKATE